MGVRGLTNYLKRKGFRSDTKVFSLTSPDQFRLVVDVSSLIYFIYNHHCNWICGGDYSKLKLAIRSYIFLLNLLVGWDGESQYDPEDPHSSTNFLNSGLVVWVMDGVSDKSKEVTVMNRFDKKLQKLKQMVSDPTSYSETNRPHYFVVKPLLCERMFVELLKEFNQSVVMAYSEADSTMVYLAHLLDASVMGIDSDFFIYDIPQGYLDLNCLTNAMTSLEVMVDCLSYREAIYLANSGMLPITFLMPWYHKHQIAKFLNVGMEQMALVATLIGTDKTNGIFDLNLLKRKLQIPPTTRSVDQIKLVLDYVTQFCVNLPNRQLLQQLQTDFQLNQHNLNLTLLSIDAYKTPVQDPQLEFQFLPILPPNVEFTVRQAYRRGNLNYRNLGLFAHAQFFGSPLLEISSPFIHSAWYLTNIHRYQLFHIATCPPQDISEQQHHQHHMNLGQTRLRCLYPAGDGMALADPMSASVAFRGTPLERIMDLHQLLHSQPRMSRQALLAFLLQFLCGQLSKPIQPTKFRWEALPPDFALVLACVLSIINYNPSYFPARDLTRSVRGYWLMFSILNNMDTNTFPIPSLPQARNPNHKLHPSQQPTVPERPTLSHFKFSNLLQATLLTFEPFLTLFGFGEGPRISTYKFMDVPLFLECVKIVDRCKSRRESIQWYLAEVLGPRLGNIFNDYHSAVSYTDPMLK